MKRFSILVFSILAVVFNAGCAESSKNAFDSEYAFNLLEKQCAFGARVPGTAGHDSCTEFIKQEISKYCDTVIVQAFEKRMSYSKKPVKFTNLICEMNKDSKKHIMLFSHYDSRPFSSQKGTPTPGANDGASSSAVLIALAEMLQKNGFKDRVTFVFFDGEDGGTNERKDEWFVGSEYFAENYTEEIPDVAILLDMIGDKNQTIFKEGYSDLVNDKLNSQIFTAAKKANVKTFVNRIGYFVEDDHLPLNRKGFRCVNIIDMDYKWWHTPYDTPDKCSRESLENVAKVIEAVLYER